MKYYIENNLTTKNVNYCLLDGNNNILFNFYNYACFSNITYKTIHQDCKVVQIYHQKDKVPYNLNEVRRWITDISEMGFPCAFVEKKDMVAVNGSMAADRIDFNDYYFFHLKLNDYKYKSHLVSALSLVRCLTETHICKVPAIYFDMVDKNPHGNKFDMMQTAHRNVGDYIIPNGYGYNYNHMVTYKGNGTANITKDKLFQRYEIENVGVFADHEERLPQSAKWIG